MKRLLLSFALLLLLWSCSPVVASAGAPLMTGSEFHDAMRKLWEDHVTWTRLFVVSALADPPDRDPTTDGLLQNQ